MAAAAWTCRRERAALSRARAVSPQMAFRRGVDICRASPEPAGRRV